VTVARLKAWHLLAGTHLAAGIAGYLMAEERLDSEVEHTGWFSADTKKTLAAAVLSLQNEQKLLVYSYRGAANVRVERSELLGILRGTQSLTLPARVSYQVDLSDFSSDDVEWNPAAATLTVHLPPLVMGEVAFEPEAAVVNSEGPLTYSDAQVQELARLSYRTARRAFIAQAQQVTLVETARRRARETVERHFGVALAAAGRPEARVVARFRPR
jgi:hypothetical protein